MHSEELMRQYDEWLDVRFESREPDLHERASSWFRENRPVRYYERFYEWVEKGLGED